jgi:hypothetical protein
MPRMEATVSDSSKVGVPLRVGAVILALVLALVCAGIIAGAHDNTSLPTCHDVSHGKAKLPSSGDCFDGSSTRANAGMVFAIGAGIATAAALVLSIMLAATGLPSRGRLFLISVGVAVALIGLEIAVIHL